MSEKNKNKVVPQSFDDMDFDQDKINKNGVEQKNIIGAKN